MEKHEWRKYFLAARRALSAFQRASFSSAIHRRVLSHPAWQRARTVGAYIALPDEVQTHSLLRLARECGKQLAAPIVDPLKQRLTFHKLSRLADVCLRRPGLLEPSRSHPVAHEQLDLVLVPGIGFDERGFRLGFGKGYYDRFLETCRAFRMGLAFENQLTSLLPTKSWDIPVNCIVTEKRLIPVASS
jgi:5-formyltetrahydrofolate cyclo-ligase